MQISPKSQLVQFQFITLLMKQTLLSIQKEQGTQNQTSAIPIYNVCDEKKSKSTQKEPSSKFHRSNPIVQLRSDLSTDKSITDFNEKTCNQFKKIPRSKFQSFT